MPLQNSNTNTIPTFKNMLGGVSVGPTPPVETFFIQLENGTGGPNGGFLQLEQQSTPFGTDFMLTESAP